MSDFCDTMDCNPQAPLSIGFTKKEYWSGSPFPSPWDLLYPGIKMHLLNWQADSLLLSHQRSPWLHQLSPVQSLSHVRLCDPINHSMPGLPVHHQLPEFTQTHVHQVGDAIQPSHPLSSPSPPAPNSSQHQGLFPMSQLFAWGGQSIALSASASVLPMNT